MKDTEPLRVLLVDDEPLARERLRSLLSGIEAPQTVVCGQAATAAQAIEQMLSARPDVVLLDINMPGMDGMELARRMQNPPDTAAGLAGAQTADATGVPACQIIFVTASEEHALQAFDVAATDYLTKPVRRERLQQALLKAVARLSANQAVPADNDSTGPALLLQERGNSQRLPIADILYARAEQKYVTLHTRSGRELLWDGTLNQLEEDYPQYFVRIHRSTLVRRQSMRQLKLCAQTDGAEASWLLRLEENTQWLPVSRRQLLLVRQAFQNM